MTSEAEQILAIPLGEPGRLFKANADWQQKQYRQLAAKWHPDRRNGNASVFAHVQALYIAAQAMLAAGHWEAPGEIHFKTVKGSLVTLKYRRKHVLDWGEMYIGDHIVSLAFTDENKDLSEQYVRMATGFKFIDARVKEDHLPCLPFIKRPNIDVLSGADRHWIIVHKPGEVAQMPDLLCLRDVLAHYKGAMPPTHVAWVVSRLLALGTYLGLPKLGNLMHGDIGLDSVFIQPADHRVALLGGWQFAARLGDRIKALPARSQALGLGPGIAKHSDTSTLIRATGIELLGSTCGGSDLIRNKAIPKPMLSWLRSVGTEKPLDEFRQWRTVLEASFGPRKFIKMDLTAEMLYA